MSDQCQVYLLSNARGGLCVSRTTTVVQRNGLTLKIEGEGASDDDIAFRAVGGFGPWKRAYRPGAFAAYFIGARKDKETFHAQLEKLVAL